MFVRRAAVVGAGTMGGQIAQVIAAAGLPVLLRDIDGARARVRPRRGPHESARPSSAGLVAAGKLSEHAAAEQVEQLLARITAVDDWSGFGEVDVVVEAVPERLEVKQEVFAALDACVGGQALLASNTSALSITQLGEATLRPERVVGLHFFYPASLMPLVEIVEGEETSQETLTDAVAFVQQIRKQPIRCLEVPGFVVNRILNSVTSEVWQRPGARRPFDRRDRRGPCRRRRRSRRPLPARRPARPGHRAARRRASRRLLRRGTLPRARVDAAARRQRQTRREARWRRLLSPGRQRSGGRRRRRPTSTRSPSRFA